MPHVFEAETENVDAKLSFHLSNSKRIPEVHSGVWYTKWVSVRNADMQVIADGITPVADLGFSFFPWKKYRALKMSKSERKTSLVRGLCVQNDYINRSRWRVDAFWRKNAKREGNFSRLANDILIAIKYFLVTDGDVLVFGLTSKISHQSQLVNYARILPDEKTFVFSWKMALKIGVSSS